MKAYKFLTAGGVARFSGHPWATTPPGRRPVIPCRSGFHACRLRDLPYWIDDELWVVRLGGTIEELDFGVLAEEGWLVERVDRWPNPVAGELERACVDRVRGRAVRELTSAGRDEEAERLRALSTAPEDLAAFAQAATEVAGALPAGAPAPAVHLVRYAGDAAAQAAASPDHPFGQPAIVAYVAAYAAGRATPSAGEHYGPGVTMAEAERSWQARWLGDRLGLG